MFSPTDIDIAVKTAFASASSIPSDHRGAVLFAADQDGAKVILAARVSAGSPWTISAIVDHPWTGGLQYGVTLGRTW